MAIEFPVTKALILKMINIRDNSAKAVDQILVEENNFIAVKAKTLGLTTISNNNQKALLSGMVVKKTLSRLILSRVNDVITGYRDPYNLLKKWANIDVSIFDKDLLTYGWLEDLQEINLSGNRAVNINDVNNSIPDFVISNSSSFSTTELNDLIDMESVFIYLLSRLNGFTIPLNAGDFDNLTDLQKSIYREALLKRISAFLSMVLTINRQDRSAISVSNVEKLNLSIEITDKFIEGNSLYYYFNNE